MLTRMQVTDVFSADGGIDCLNNTCLGDTQTRCALTIDSK